MFKRGLLVHADVATTTTYECFFVGMVHAWASLSVDALFLARKHGP
jgi:hypothetical protein